MAFAATGMDMVMRRQLTSKRVAAMAAYGGWACPPAIAQESALRRGVRDAAV